MRNLILCGVLLFSHMLTAFGQTADSVSFSTDETKVLLRSWENESRYIAKSDSMSSVISNQQTIIKADSLLRCESELIIKGAELLIFVSSEYEIILEKQLKKETRWRKFWRGFWIFTTGTSVGVITYQALQND